MTVGLGPRFIRVRRDEWIDASKVVKLRALMPKTLGTKVYFEGGTFLEVDYTVEQLISTLERGCPLPEITYSPAND